MIRRSSAPALALPDRPQLVVIVDTEEEFDWTRPLARENVATRSVPAQAAAHDLYDRFGVVPTYVVDYPVATDAQAVAFFRGLVESGRAEIGAHLHPWVTPPHDETVDRRNSYHGNLPLGLERAKIVALTEAIESSFGQRPTIFKAGRNGFGPNTAGLLADLGYRVDCSFLPFNDLSREDGPNFCRTPDQPFWLDRTNGLLEVPMTAGYIGRAAGAGRHIQWLFDNQAARRLHLPGILSHAGLVARSRLTPEGVSAREQCRLLETLVGQGRRVFSLVYHSPSLAPGCTPYVKNAAQLAQFLERIEAVLRFFRESLGGEFTTLSRLRDACDSGEERAAA